MSICTVRPVRPADYSLIWRWRNDAVTRRMERSSDPVPWPAFDVWLRQMVADPYRCLLIAERQDCPVAFSHVRMERLSRTAEIGININPDFRGQRLATPLIKAFSRYAWARLGFRRIEARIRSVNIPSRRAFAAAGFVHDGEEASGIITMSLSLPVSGS